MHLTSKQKRRARRKERQNAYISACKKREESAIPKNAWGFFTYYNTLNLYIKSNSI